MRETVRRDYGGRHCIVGTLPKFITPTTRPESDLEIAAAYHVTKPNSPKQRTIPEEPVFPEMTEYQLLRRSGQPVDLSDGH